MRGGVAIHLPSPVSFSTGKGASGSTTISSFGWGRFEFCFFLPEGRDGELGDFLAMLEAVTYRKCPTCVREGSTAKPVECMQVERVEMRSSKFGFCLVWQTIILTWRVAGPAKFCRVALPFGFFVPIPSVCGLHGLLSYTIAYTAPLQRISA